MNTWCPGIAATVFGALGAASINVIAISQGSSERSTNGIAIVTHRIGTSHPTSGNAGETGDQVG